MDGPLVIVGMSGGVDSSVAASLLLRDGHRVEGLFMDNWAEDEDGYCTAAQDYQDARQVCAELGITLHRASFADEYRDRVFNHFLEEYRAGRTPNPDVLCNREIKFGALLGYARRLGADHLATGHYARTDDGLLYKAVDDDKDQTYFLHQVDRASLRHALFPLGGMMKSDVRAIARAAGFDNFAKKDSTGICFIGERPFREFLQRWLPAEPGDIVTDDGTVVGTHHGLMYYTYGQRTGLGVGGIEGRDDAPWYVVDKEPGTNHLIVGQGHEHPRLMSSSLRTGTPTWVDEPAVDGGRYTARIRHRQPVQDCTVGFEEDGLAIHFDTAQRAVTPGQYAVLYDGDRCLGGAVITARGIT